MCESCVSEAFASQDLEGDFTVNNNDIEFDSNRRLSRSEQMDIFKGIEEQLSQEDSKKKRKVKHKAKRRSNDDSEKVFPSGLIRVNPKDTLDQGQIPTSSVIPALNPMFNRQLL